MEPRVHELPELYENEYPHKHRNSFTLPKCIVSPPDEKTYRLKPEEAKLIDKFRKEKKEKEEDDRHKKDVRDYYIEHYDRSPILLSKGEGKFVLFRPILSTEYSKQSLDEATEDYDNDQPLVNLTEPPITFCRTLQFNLECPFAGYTTGNPLGEFDYDYFYNPYINGLYSWDKMSEEPTEENPHPYAIILSDDEYDRLRNEVDDMIDKREKMYGRIENRFVKLGISEDNL